ncbi:hypothetical protein GCM10008967_37010 [Bacillus carboniphilus]|uniref:Uncharacterized protein n=1 Tax=Bacillus carboniphilus TaxID=86663 RepID=A0ABP3GE24_9BACI
MRERFRTYLLILLLLITAIGIFLSLRTFNLAKELQEEKEELIQNVATLEGELQDSSNRTEELQGKNSQLEEDLSSLKDEIDAIKSPIPYQDIQDAIKTVESYKSVEKLAEVNELLARENGIGLYFMNREEECPCGISFSSRSFEWIPNAVLDLKEFKMENEKLLLTYSTIDDIKHDYQFVLSKGLGRSEPIEGWYIEDINLIAKE